jgi:citrate lyase subunit beta / citryl-CoA lyase
MRGFAETFHSIPLTDFGSARPDRFGAAEEDKCPAENVSLTWSSHCHYCLHHFVIRQDRQMPSPAQFRSWMFVPGNRERFLEKARSSDADAILLDLEDGVLPAEKAQARRMVAETLGQEWHGPHRYVRVNALSTPWFKDDLETVVRPGIEGVCLTKVQNPDEIKELSSMLDALERRNTISPGTVRVVAAIESARGLLNAAAIAETNTRMQALMFGAEDYALDLGLGAKREGEAAELIYARSSLVNAAAAAHVLSIDGVFPNLDDPDGLLRDTIQARRLGFTSKSTFNPRQIDLINRIFSPQPEEIEYARKVAKGFHEAEARGDASVAVGGQLVDRPIVLRALRMLEIVGGR